MCDQVDGLLKFDEIAAKNNLDKSERPEKPKKPGQEEEEKYWGNGDVKDPCCFQYKLDMAGDDILRTPGQHQKNLEYVEGVTVDDFHTEKTMHPLVKHRMDVKDRE